MAAFDERAWVKRARKRFAAKRGAPAARRLLRDLNAAAGLEALDGWCEDNGLTLSFEPVAVGEFKGRKVTVPSAYCPESQLFVCLHECGHFIIDNDGTNRYRRGWAARKDPRRNRSFSHRATLVVEEDAAWESGLRLARGLGICLNEERFDAYRYRRLKGYFMWAVGEGWSIYDDEEEG